MWTRLLLLVLLSVVIVARQVMLKHGLDQVGGLSFSRLPESLLAMAGSPWILASVLLSGLTSLWWLWLLSRLPLSIATTVLGVSALVFRVLASWLVLGEEIPPTRWLGVVVAALGVYLIAR